MQYEEWRVKQKALTGAALLEHDARIASGQALSVWTIAAAREVTDLAAEAVDPIHADWIAGPCNPAVCLTLPTLRPIAGCLA